jgi:N-acetylglucosamine-6-phosphate deacetylase
MNDISEISAVSYSTGKPVRIRISGGFIRDIMETGHTEGDPDLLVAPGLFDNQVNGFRGADFSDTDLKIHEMRQAVDALNAEGVTSFFPTVLTNSHENLLRIFKNLSNSLSDERVKDSIPGFHLEGPYISPESGYYGCHPAGFIRKPSWDEFAMYQEAAEGKIREVTISPETDESFEFIKKCTSEGVVVAIGHTNASTDQINKAVDNGARLSTHLGNGCANMIHRHNNPLWPQLANDLLITTFIADGHHLTPEEIRVFYRVKGPAKLILTSDITHLSGLKPGNYMFFGSRIVMTDDGLIKNPVLDCLAGASLPLRTGIGNVMKFTGCPPGEAFNMASANVAEAFGITDRGTLEPGRRADLVLFERNGYEIVIKQVFVKGRRVL